MMEPHKEDKEALVEFQVCLFWSKPISDWQHATPKSQGAVEHTDGGLDEAL